MRISIFGLGYVGAVSLACLVRDGHHVTGVDIDQKKLDLMRAGKSPIIEEGIQELMQEVAGSSRMQVTDNAAQAIENSQISFVCVGTPSKRNGEQDITGIEKVSANIGRALENADWFHVVVIRSTVAPGTLENVVAPIIENTSGKKLGEGFGLCFQPEFLREGSSIKDYDNPPYTIVGGDSDRSTAYVRELFEGLPCEFYSTDISTAEMLKYACNTFHAVKITFANEIGRLAQSMGVDSNKVMGLVCNDTQLNISPAYLRPGFAFGGSCLPKDLKALLYLGKGADVETPMLKGVLASNQEHIEHALDFVLSSGKRKVGMIGLSFKSGTDDLRESPLVTLAEQFIGKGLDLQIYDPEVNLSRLIGANRRYIENAIPHIGSLMSDDYEQMLRHSELIIVGLNDKELIDQLTDSLNKEKVVLDLVGIPDRDQLTCTYRGVCW